MTEHMQAQAYAHPTTKQTLGGLYCERCASYDCMHIENERLRLALMEAHAALRFIERGKCPACGRMRSHVDTCAIKLAMSHATATLATCK